MLIFALAFFALLSLIVSLFHREGRKLTIYFGVLAILQSFVEFTPHHNSYLEVGVGIVYISLFLFFAKKILDTLSRIF